MCTLQHPKLIYGYSCTLCHYVAPCFRRFPRDIAYSSTTNTLPTYYSGGEPSRIFLLMASSSSEINPSASEARFSYKDASHEEVLEDLSRYMPTHTSGGFH